MRRYVFLALVLGTWPRPAAAAAVRQVTDDLTDDMPLLGDPAVGYYLYAMCGSSRVCVLPGLDPVGSVMEPGVTMLYPGWGGKALIEVPGGTFPEWGPGAGSLLAILVGRLPRPLIVRREWWDDTGGGCVPGAEESLAAPGANFDLRFGGAALLGWQMRDGCPAATGCAVPHQEVVLGDGVVHRRLTTSCGVSSFGGVSDGEHAAWMGTVTWRPGEAAKCGVYIDDEIIVEEAAGATCPVLHEFRDGTVLFWTQAGGFAVARDGGTAIVPLPIEADEDPGRGDIRSASMIRLLAGGLVIMEPTRRSDPFMARIVLVDAGGARHVLRDWAPTFTGLDDGVDSDAAGRVAWVSWYDNPPDPERMADLHVWRAGADRVVTTEPFTQMSEPTLGAGDRIAFAGVTLADDRREPGYSDREIYLDPGTGSFERVTVNDWEDERLVFAARTLWWTGRPPNRGGEPADLEIFTGGPPPPVCLEDGHGHRLAEAMVQYTPPGGGGESLTADADGCLAGLDPGSGGTVRVTLRDGRDLVRVFRDIPGAAANSVWFDAPVAPVVVPQAATDSNLAPAVRWHLDDLAQIYHFTQRAARFARERLFDPAVLGRIVPASPLPSLGGVDVVGFDATGGTRYQPRDAPLRPVIFISHDDSLAGSPARPDNCEYHEYGHHVMASSVMNGGASGFPDSGGCSRNHWGFLNGWSSDSFVEAWAEFFSTVARAEIDGDPRPFLYTVGATWTLDLRTRQAFWFWCGLGEEWAVAAALWDGFRFGIPVDRTWVAFNSARCTDATCVHEQLAGPGFLSASLAEWVFTSHAGLFHDRDGDFSWDASEDVGRPALTLAFVVEADTDDAGGLACRTLPGSGERCAQAGGYVPRGPTGMGLMGTFPEDSAPAVCTRGHLRPIHLRDVSGSPGYGDVTTTPCDGAAPPATGVLDERRILMLGEPWRRGVPPDMVDPTRIDLVDAGTGASIAEGLLTATVACTGSDGPLSHTTSGPVRDLPRGLHLGVPEGECTMEVTATAPGYDTSDPLVVTSAQAAAGELPEAHSFELDPTGEPPAPTATVTADPVSGTTPLRVHLRADVTGGLPPYTVHWLAGDGTSLEGEDVDHVYGDTSGGVYMVLALIYDAMGQETQAGTTVEVTGRPGADGDADGDADAPDGDAGDDGGDADAGAPSGGSGCSCRAAGRAAESSAAAVVGLLAALLLRAATRLERGRRAPRSGPRAPGAATAGSVAGRTTSPRRPGRSSRHSRS